MINVALMPARRGTHFEAIQALLRRRGWTTTNRTLFAPIPGLEGSMDRVDCVIIGAGVIGLAVARRLARAGREVIVLEAAEGIGTVTSSRNSEVIHAGIYYKAGSLMARMCVAGKRALYAYCADHGIPHKNCGKLIVATTPKET